MAFNSNIPQAGDVLSQSQADLLNNFGAINTAFNLNHGNFNAANQGKHLFLEMPVVADQVTAAGEVGVYCKNGATSGVPELFFRRQSAGAITPMTEASAMANGWTWLPSGLLMQWGTQVNTGGPNSYNFPIAFPTACLQVVVGTLFNTDQNKFTQLVGFTQTQFSIFSTQRTANVATTGSCTFWAIGN